MRRSSRTTLSRLQMMELWCALYEFSDVLSAQERAELEMYWRREFNRSFAANFSFCAGPDKIFSGDDARWQHWPFVDLPPPLLEKFMAEREQRGRVVCELQEESASMSTETAAEGSA